MKKVLLTLITVLITVITSNAQVSAIVYPNGSTTFCKGKSVKLTVKVSPSAMYQYQWLRNGTAISGANSTSYTANASGVYLLVLRDLKGKVYRSNTITVNVNTSSTKPLFKPIGAVCKGSKIKLPTISANGIYGSWSPAFNDLATTTYTFTPSPGQCATTATLTVSIIPLRKPLFSQISSICAGGIAKLPNISDNGIYGSWSPATNGTSSSTTTYIFTPKDGQCASTISVTLDAKLTKTPVFNQIPTICSGGLTSLPNISSNGVIGTWSQIGNTPSSGTVATTYLFTPTAGQCATATTISVNVGSLRTPTFNQHPAICPGVQIKLPSISTNGITGSWSPAVNNNATTTYVFTPTSGQCAASAKMTIVVNTSKTPIFTQIPSVCSGGMAKLPTVSSNGIYGTWSPSLTTVVTAPTTFTFTPVAGQCATTATVTVNVGTSIKPKFDSIPTVCSGAMAKLPTVSSNGIYGMWSPSLTTIVTAPTTFTFTPVAGQCATTATVTVNVGTSIKPKFDSIPTVCSGASAKLPTVSSNGIYGTWSPSLTTVVTAPTTFTFTPVAGQCATTATVTVNVGTSVKPVFNQLPTICYGANVKLPSISSNGIYGTWSPSLTTVVTAPTTFTFTPIAGQCATTTTVAVNVGTSIKPKFDSIPTVCSGATAKLPTVSSNGIYGTWSPSLTTVVTAPTTFTFTPIAGQCATTTTVTVNVGTSIKPKFDSIPTVCSGATAKLPTISSNGIYGTWSPSLTTVVTAPTTFTFTPIAGQCATTATVTVNVGTSIKPKFDSIPTVCAGGMAKLPTISSNGIYGTWSPSLTTVVTAPTTFTFTPIAGQCATTATVPVNVSGSATIPKFNQIPAICAGGTVNLPSISTNAIYGTWSPALNNTITTSTTYTFTPISGQCASTATVLVNVRSLPKVVLDSFAIYCNTDGLVKLTGGSPSGGIYSGISVVNNVFDASVGADTYLIKYTYADTNGCYNSASQYLQVINCKSSKVQEFSKTQVQVYPNPIADYFIINAPQEFVGRNYTLLDGLGRNVSSGVIGSTDEKLNVSGLASGTYHLTIEFTSEKYMLIKQ